MSVIIGIVEVVRIVGMVKIAKIVILAVRFYEIEN